MGYYVLTEQYEAPRMYSHKPQTRILYAGKVVRVYANLSNGLSVVQIDGYFYKVPSIILKRREAAPLQHGKVINR